MAGMDALRSLFGAATRSFGTLLLAFGLGLLVVGGVVQLSRMARVAGSEQAEAPRFDDSLRATAVTRATAPAAFAVVTVSLTDVPLDGLDASAPESRGLPTPSPTPAPLPERIAIPALALDRRVVEIGWTTELVDNDTLRKEWETASHAAGFHRGSAPPGAPGNTVISGHNNIDGAIFRDLHRIEPGERIYLYAGDARHAYEVETNFVLREAGVSEEQRIENGKWIGPTPDERLTLVTCYPPWGNSHRTVVVARPIDDAGDDAGEGAAAEPPR